MAGWMTNLSSKKKKPACMHIRMRMNKMKAEDKIKNKTSQNKQKKTINSITNWHSSKATRQFRNERERESE